MNSVIILEDLVFKSTLSRRKRILDNQIRSRGGLMVTFQGKSTLPKWADKNSEFENLGDTKA